MSLVWGLEDQTEMQKRLEGADLGYLRMNIVDPFCGVSAWGLYNSRLLIDAAVNKILEAYKAIGVLACQVDKVIYLPMRASWFVGSTIPVISGKYVYEVPLLKLTAEGEAALAAGLITPLSGNHRRAALVLYYNQLVAQLKQLEEEVKGLEDEEKIEKNQEIAVMRKRVEHAPFWTVRIYDYGTSFSRTGRIRVSLNHVLSDKLIEGDPQKLAFTYLSENETLPSSRAAEEDSLHAWCGKFIYAEDLDRAADLALTAAGNEPSAPSHSNFDQALAAALAWASGDAKYDRILSCRFSRGYFLTLSRLPAHYRSGPELKMANLLARQHRAMGVSYSNVTIQDRRANYFDSLRPPS